MAARGGVAAAGNDMTDLREVRAAGIGFATIACYAVAVLATGRVELTGFAHLLTFYLGTSFSIWAILGMFGALRLLYRHRPRNGASVSALAILADWARGKWARDRCVSLLWPPVLFALLMASFNAFKQMVLPAAGFRFDPLFASLDRALFLGHDPWRITHGLFGSPGATGFIDTAYHGWFVPMSLGVMVCAWLPRESFRLRTQYLLSYIAIWIGIGTVLAFLLPAAGPCFYTHFVGPAPEFQALMERLATDQTALGRPVTALTIQHMLLQSFGGGGLAVGGGISAMPSVHNALAVVFAFAAFRLNRWAGIAMAGYAALIWFGSIHLGWHYAIDGIAAVALAFGIWKLAGRIAARLDIAPAPAPVIALA